MRLYPIRPSILLAAALWACSGSGTGVGSPSPGSRNLITREEIVESGLFNAYDIIQRLRSRWLSPRIRSGSMSAGTGLPAIYVGDQYWGEVESLRQITAESIAEIRYLSPRDATTRGWNRNDAGAIQIVRTIGDGPG